MSSPDTVVAVAVDSNVIYAELAPELIGDQNVTVSPAAPRYKGISRTKALFTMVAVSLVCLAVGLGLYYGITASDKSAPMDRTTVLTSYINSISLSKPKITANGTSPESMALSWLIANNTTLDTAALLSEDDPISNNAIGFRIRQLYPLLVMWFQQTATEKWANTTGWLEDPNECTWHGITCATMNLTFNDLVQSNSFVNSTVNAVVKISFADVVSGYVGTIPVELGLLTHLQHFEIRDTQVDSGEVASSLKGSLPESIGQWTALTYFGVSNNSGLVGALPGSVYQWTALTYFDFSDNGLEGTLPDGIGQWTALTYFDIGNNVGLTGKIPLFTENWTALTHFDVSANALTGILPDTIGQWSMLTYFNSNYNYGTTGTLPESIGQWIALTYFDVSSSALIGTLPDSIGQWTALTFVNIGGTHFTGTLPDSIGQWNALSYFFAESTTFSGTIPSSIGNWSLIQVAYFGLNQFTGSMPKSICQY
jgi:hypothetical protein